MGFFKGLKKIAGGLLGAFAPAIGGAVGGPFGAAVGSGLAKIPGIPGVGGASGRSLGRDARDYFDQAYPGTTAWERLGGSGYAGAGVESAKQTSEAAERMQSKELATRERVAKIQAEATTQSAAITHGPDALAGVREFRKSGVATPFETPTTIAATRLPSEIRRNISAAMKGVEDARLTGSKADVEAEVAKFAKLLARYRVTKEAAPNLYGSLRNLATGVMTSADGKVRKFPQPDYEMRAKAVQKFKDEVVKFFTDPWTKPKKSSISGKPVRGSTHYKNQ